MNNHPEYKTLLLDVDNHVGRIILNRPEAANALNRQMFLDLFQAVLYCDENTEVRAVLIGNAGKVFCAGGDLREFAAQENLAGSG